MIKSAVHLPIAFLALVLILFSGPGHSALLPILGGTMVYDDDRDITWLADANYAGGTMTWSDALSWADTLVFGGLSDWRLPTALNSDESGPCTGYLCTSSELGHLFYDELGGAIDVPLSITHNANYDSFSNIPDDIYWSAEALIGPNPPQSWVFRTDQFAGIQGGGLQSAPHLAWAVRDGNALAAVPLPAGIWLFGSGLIGLFGFARKSKK